MKKKASKIFAVLTLVLFVNFMFSNTVFVHSHHTDDGRRITHSHPYLPSSHHSHSAQSLSLISLMNISAASAEAACPIVHTALTQLCVTMECHCSTYARMAELPCENPRGPPAM
ncbi:MAG: hypothetical protein K2G24_04765 [Muribaculaceae bacterium]|nr:hypothetical protein [Muribaculaceae bacterium]